MITAERKWKALQTLATIALLYGVGALKAGPEVAAWFLACGVTGYFNAFHVVRLPISLAKGRKPGRAALLVAAAAIISSCVIVYFGFGLVLVLTTSAFVLIDAVVLRFE